MKEPSLLHLLFLLSLVSPIFSLFKSSYPIPNTGYSTDDDTVINVFPDPVNPGEYGAPPPHWPERTQQLPSIGRLPIPFPSDEGSVGGSLGYGAPLSPWDYYASGIRGANSPNAVGLDDYYGFPYIPEGVDSIPAFGPEIFDRYYGDAGRYVFGDNVPGYGPVGGLGYGASSLPWVAEGTYGDELYPMGPEDGYELPVAAPASDNDPILIQVFPDTVPSRGYGVPPLPQGTEGSDGDGSFGGYGNGGYGTGPLDVDGESDGSGPPLPGDNEKPVPSPIGWPFVFPREEEGEGPLGGYGSGGYGTGPLDVDGDGEVGGATLPGDNEKPVPAPSPIGWPFVFPRKEEKIPRTNVEDIDPVNPVGIDEPEKEGDNEDGSGFPELCDPHGNWDCILYRR